MFPTFTNSEKFLALGFAALAYSVAEGGGGGGFFF
jgi:hypothetical protein